MATENVKIFEEGKKGSFNWLWLIPLLLVLGLLGWLLTRHHAAPATTSAVPASDSTKPDSGAGAMTAAAGTTWTAASIGDTLRTKGRVGFNDAEVHFATASATLAGDSQAVLDQAARALQDNNDWHIRVVGYTDSVGSTASNDQLAGQRAQSVKTYLVNKGVDQGRLSTDEKGPREPTASNASDSGRAENRRVELIKE